MTEIKLAELLNIAFEMHNKKEYKKAESLYKKILSIDPSNYNALHLCGVVIAQAGDLNQAVDLISKAIEKWPNSADAYYNRGNIFNDLGNHKAAISDFRIAAGIDLNHIGARYNCANTFQKIGDLDKALQWFNEVVKINPKHIQTYLNLGLIYKVKGSFDLALKYFNLAIDLDPKYIKALSNKANLLSEIGQFHDASTIYQNIVNLDSNNPISLASAGLCWANLNDYNKAIVFYHKALEINHYSYEILVNLGSAYSALGCYHQAIQNYDKAILISSQSPEAHLNKAAAAISQGDFEFAMQVYEEAIKYCVNNAEIIFWKARLHALLLESDDAISCYLDVIRINPNHAEAHAYLALSYLLLGNFSDGWEEYTWRKKIKESYMFIDNLHLNIPEWTGTDVLYEKKILIRSEQGLGDTLQFVRYLRLLKNEGAFVILEVQPELYKVFVNYRYADILIEKGRNSSISVDYQCYLMDLPRIFLTQLETIPPIHNLVTLEATEVCKWENMLDFTKLLRVGIVWSGRPEHPNDSNRSICYEDFSIFIKNFTELVQFVSLQKHLRIGERIDFLEENKICYFGDKLHDLKDTANLCSHMDIVISVDTSVAHLSSSMGKETWILLPYVPDWRWLLAREDSPWYPSARLFRQKSRGNWKDVFTEISVALEQKLAKKLSS